MGYDVVWGVWPVKEGVVNRFLLIYFFWYIFLRSDVDLESARILKSRDSANGKKGR